MFRRFVVVSLVSSFVACLTSESVAQQSKNAPKGTAIKVDGTVEQVVPQGILVTGKDKKQYAVGFTPTSKVGLVGTAGIDYVKPGTFVQFEVNLDGKGVPTEEVKKVQITQQSATVTPAISPSKGPDYKEGEPDLFFVRGTVRTNKNNELTVVADKRSITVKVAEGITVPVTIADWTLAKKGDEIKGDGTAFTQPNLPYTLVQGTQIEIKAAAPIDFSKKK
jgi:hypothetical protein